MYNYKQYLSTLGNDYDVELDAFKESFDIYLRIVGNLKPMLVEFESFTTKAARQRYTGKKNDGLMILDILVELSIIKKVYSPMNFQTDLDIYALDGSILDIKPLGQYDYIVMLQELKSKFKKELLIEANTEKLKT